MNNTPVKSAQNSYRFFYRTGERINRKESPSSLCQQAAEWEAVQTRSERPVEPSRGHFFSADPFADTTGVSIWRAFKQFATPASREHWINIDALHFHSCTVIAGEWQMRRRYAEIMQSSGGKWWSSRWDIRRERSFLGKLWFIINIKITCLLGEGYHHITIITHEPLNPTIIQALVWIWFMMATIDNWLQEKTQFVQCVNNKSTLGCCRHALCGTSCGVQNMTFLLCTMVITYNFITFNI